MQPGTPRPGGAAYALPVALAVAALLAALPTYLLPDLLRGPAAANGSARGTALVVSVLAVPVLLLALRSTARGSARGLVVELGAIGYVLYNAVMFVFATPFNRLFLPYVAMLSLALWSLVVVLVRTDLLTVGDRVGTAFPVRAVAGYVLVVAVLNALAWLAPVLRATTGDPASVLDGTGVTTNPVYVQDLAVWLPLMAVAAGQMVRGRPWARVVVGAGLVLWVLESVGIAVDQAYGSAADPSSPVASASAVPIFAALAVVGLVPLALLLRAVDVSRAGRPDETRPTLRTSGSAAGS